MKVSIDLNMSSTKALEAVCATEVERAGGLICGGVAMVAAGCTTLPAAGCAAPLGCLESSLLLASNCWGMGEEEDETKTGLGVGLLVTRGVMAIGTRSRM